MLKSNLLAMTIFGQKAVGVAEVVVLKLDGVDPGYCVIQSFLTHAGIFFRGTGAPSKRGHAEQRKAKIFKRLHT